MNILKDLFNNLLCVVFGCKNNIKERLVMDDAFLSFMGDCYQGSEVIIYECSRCGQLSGGDVCTASFKFEGITK